MNGSYCENCPSIGLKKKKKIRAYKKGFFLKLGVPTLGIYLYFWRKNDKKTIPSYSAWLMLELGSP